MKMQAEIAFQLSKQGNRYVAYAPALDISTSGKTEAEAKRRFGELMPLFLDELVEAGTLADVLTELGWQQEKGAKATAGWKPPVVKNEHMQVRIPVAA